MQKQIVKREWNLTPCPTCGKTLTNPGYSRVSVMCCGAYHPWGRYEDVTYNIETGRDEKGRFTGTPVRWSRVYA